MVKPKKVTRKKIPKKQTPLSRILSSYTGPLPQRIIDDILAKRDLLVHPQLCETVVRRYLGKNPALLPRLTDPTLLRSVVYEKMRKWVRQELRVLVGLFVIETDPQKLLQSDAETILSSHRSTKERLPFYELVYGELFGEKQPQHILDLCAGINGCAYNFFPNKPKYTALDVSPQLMDFTQAWFTLHGVEGTAQAADVTQLPDEQLKAGDVVFLFKATDVLERVHYGYGEELLRRLFALGPEGRRVVVSFATATIGGGREIKVTKRKWVERWAEQHGRRCNTVDTENERYYILE